MAYDANSLVKLGQLKTLAERTHAEDKALAGRIKTLEEAGGQPNVLEGVKINNTALAIANKMVDILVATGSANGTIKVNNVDISVAGLAALAYKAEVSEDELATALKNKIDGLATQTALGAVSDKVDLLIGNTEGDDEKSVREIAANEVAKIVANADTKYDTLKEIADWILSDTTGAAKMSSDISALKDKLVLGTRTVEGQEVEYATVKAYVEAVVASFISLTALSAETTGEGNAVTALSYNDATGKFTATKGKTFIEQVASATATHIPTLTAAGQLTDSGKTLDDYVEKETGKGLSTNDFTTAYKDKLDGIKAGATKVEESSTNGNIKIDNEEVTVYTLPSDVIQGSVAADADVTAVINAAFTDEEEGE